jgi:membrane protein involved in colicin uptake
MPRHTLARRNLLTLASAPWTLYEDDPGAGGGGGGGNEPQLNEHGYPDATPIAEMSTEHQAAYWKHQSRKHEQRASQAPDAAELERLKERDAALKKLEDEQLTETQRVQAEKDAAEAARLAAEAERDAAVAEAVRIRIAADKGLTPAQAERLRGTTKEELEADAEELLKLFGTTGQGSNGGAGNGGPPRSGGPRGNDVGGSKTITTGAERYRQRHGK